MRAGVLCIAVLGLFPTAAHASMTFGSDLSLPADSLSSQCAPISPPCTMLQYRVHPGNAFPATAPVAGLLTSFGLKAGAGETVTFRLGRIDTHSGNGTGDATGPTVSVKGPGTYSFPASLWVHAGDSVGLNLFSAASFTTQPNCYLGSHSYWFSPPLADGGGSSRAPGANGVCEWLVNATFTPSPRGLALLRCAHRHGKAKKAKCRRRARKLPVLPS